MIQILQYLYTFITITLYNFIERFVSKLNPTTKYLLNLKVGDNIMCDYYYKNEVVTLKEIITLETGCKILNIQFNNGVTMPFTIFGRLALNNYGSHSKEIYLH